MSSSLSNSEFELIRRFTRAFKPNPPPFGPGDDAAVTANGQVVSVDALVERVHFTRETFSAEDIGHKALAVNLSDLAAMGARPTWFVCALAMPTETMLPGIARGMSALARRSGIELVGGNMTSASELSLTLTVAGQARAPMLRTGAKAGDLLYVSGTLGDARRGLFELRQGRRSGPLVRRQRRPSPRLELALRVARFVNAAIDLSDGLPQDLSHLCKASGVGASVRIDALPISQALKRAAGASAWEWALAGGEDYELLLAVPARASKAFEAAAPECTRIGELTSSRAISFTRAGILVRPERGFDHFAPAKKPR